MFKLLVLLSVLAMALAYPYGPVAGYPGYEGVAPYYGRGAREYAPVGTGPWAGPLGDPHGGVTHIIYQSPEYSYQLQW